MKRRQSGGFTFIELMLAVSIFAIVSVAVYSTFGTGLSVWGRAQEAQNLYRDLRLALDKMAEDLENAVLYSKEAGFVDFEGKEEMVSFYSLLPSFQSALKHSQLRKITYSLEDSVLQRLEETLPESEQQIKESQPEEIAGGIKRLNFAYCYEQAGQPPYKWKDAWEFADAERKLPQGLKIELELEADESLVFNKYIFIPTGVKGAEE